MNELHFTGQETHIEREIMQLAQSHRETEWKSW